MNAYDKAISLLASREHTRRELEEKLIAKGYGNKDLLEEVLDRLEKENYLSDSRFAEVFIRSRMRRCPEGRYLLSLRLKEKGCRKEAYEDYLASYFDSGEHLPYLKKELEKLCRTKGREKAFVTLQKKGFKLSELEDLYREIEEASTLD